MTGLYRRRVAPIEAKLYDGSNAEEILAWCGGHTQGSSIVLDGSIHAAHPGDYIIRTEIPGDGSRYFPMPSAMFEHSYEEIS